MSEPIGNASDILRRTEVYLLEWQSTGCHRRLEMLLEAALPMLQACAARTLRRQGIADASAIDEAISLVLDHLRRLPGTRADEPAVARFALHHGTRARSAEGDSGTAYLLWLARERASDVARSRRRQYRRAVPFSSVQDRLRHLAEPNADPDSASCEDLPHGAGDPGRIQAVVAALEPRLRTVVELLLQGTNQASIARTLGVCEGTVSRLRARAIAELRRLMSE